MDLTLFPQLLMNGVVAGAPLAVLGLGMSLILNVTHRFHFAYALTYSFGGMCVAVLATQVGVPAPLALMLAVVGAAGLGVAIEVVVYRPLAIGTAGSALLPVFVSSLGLTIAGQSALQFLWAREAVTVPFEMFPIQPLSLPFGLRATTFDLLTVVVFGVIAAVSIWVLRYTRAGRVVRGVRGNPNMAQAVGIRPKVVYAAIFALASAGAGLAACFSAARYSATSDMGLDALFTSFVVAFLAGSSAPALRVVLIGVALGVTQSVSTIWIPSNFTNIVVFGLLFVYLIAKGAGAFDKRAIRPPTRATALTGKA